MSALKATPAVHDAADHVKVPTNARVREKWLHAHWSKEGVLLTPEDVEADIDQRLRLPQYKQSFSDLDRSSTR